MCASGSIPVVVSSLRPRRWARGLAVAAVATLAACGSGDDGGGRPAEAPPGPPAGGTAAATPEALRARADEYWRARVDENWAVVFAMLPPWLREGRQESDFVSWSIDNEPFGYDGYKLGDVLIAGAIGWVKVDSRTTMRRFPGVPPQEASRWQTWALTNGQWYPVPPQEREFYPQPPVFRDAAEEERLRARYVESMRRRQGRDWAGLYEMVDPTDRLMVTEPELADVQSMIEYVGYDVQWVEVVGANGNVRVKLTQKVTDPSLTKLPPQTIEMTETWILVGGEWYYDIVLK